jgi:hypothetical protein
VRPLKKSLRFFFLPQKKNSLFIIY